ncbi:MAG: intradiol ring-cleavage dioxygenase [Steroidobacteraceae bacterium]
MDNRRSWSRRALLKGTLAVGALGPAGMWPKLSLAADAALTPACRDGHQEQATLASAAGPYFKPDSPERGDLAEAPSDGRLITLRGRVLSRSCQPLANVLLDLWHADQNGLYDDSGFRYRGHVFSDAQGGYKFRTIEPALYPGRTRHFHFKIQAPGGQILTTQLFFPGEPRNQIDRLFRPQLLMTIGGTPELLSAQFDFFIDA